MLRSSVTVRDNGLFNRIRNVVNGYTSKVEVGYFANQGNHAGRRPITLGNLAAIHEHGTSRIPARPFVAPSLRKNRGKYLKLAGKQITPVILGRRTTTSVWHMLGQEEVKDVQSYMITASFVPLSPKTIKAKGLSKPLIDTGQLRQSVTYRVK